MWRRIQEITKTATFRHTSLVSAATIINGLLGFVFYFSLAKFFKPSILGIFTVAVTAAGLITDIAVVGTETGVVNFVGKFIKKDRQKALQFLKLAFETKVLVSLIVIILGWFLIPNIAINILGKKELILPLRYSLFASSSLLLFGFATSGLQSLQKFSIWGIINIFSNSGRLIFVYVLFTLGALSINATLAAYILLPFLAFLISFFFLPNFFKVKGEGRIFREFFHYNKWVALFSLVTAVSARLDTFLVTRLLTLKDVGIYSVAVTLSGIVPQLVGAVGTVVAPKLAALDTKEKAIKYLKKLQLFVGGLSIVGISIGISVGYIFIKKFYAPVYFESFYPYIILLIAQAIFLFSIPVHMTIIYYFSFPKFFVIISIVNMIIIGTLGWIFTINFSFTGAALAILIGNIFNFIVPAIFVIRKFEEI